MMRWFDAGVNLLDPRFDVDAVVADALASSVQRMCVITSRPADWQNAVDLYQRYPQYLNYTLGIHPHYASEASPDDFTILAELATTPGCVAIGECGLDFFRLLSPASTQVDVFEAQIAVAQAVGKPLYLHERDAFDTQTAILSNASSAGMAGIAHCFTGTLAQMERYLDMGLFIGITGWLCDEQRGQALRQCVPRLPNDKWVLETDAPYLFPKTLRPRQRNNTPANVAHIGEYFAHLQETDVAKVADTSYRNTCRLFGLGEAV